MTRRDIVDSPLVVCCWLHHTRHTASELHVLTRTRSCRVSSLTHYRSGLKHAGTSTVFRDELSNGLCHA